MLKLPKGLKKKKKGKKSKHKGDDDLFTEEELKKYRREHQQQVENGEGSVKENEEWSKFKDLTTGVDSVLNKTKDDLDRIKSTSFFQRITVKKEIKPVEKEKPVRPVVEVTEADFPHLVQAATKEADGDKSEYGVTDDESEEEDDSDIFDTSYIEAVQRGEVKLAYVPDSPEEFKDDDIFDTSYVNALIKGQEAKTSKGKKELDIGVAVEVLTGRIDNLKITTAKRSKRTIPGDLLLESEETDSNSVTKVVDESVEKSILDIDSDIPIDVPIDLSTSIVLPIKKESDDIHSEPSTEVVSENQAVEEEFDEFSQLAAESLEAKDEVIKLDQKEIKLEPVLQDSWSAFEANTKESVFAEGIVEDQLDVLDPYQDDPFDTSFADAVVHKTNFNSIKQEAVILDEDEDDDFDPRAEEVQVRLNNRRKSSVRIHLTDPSGIRESITSDDVVDTTVTGTFRDLLGGSTTDLTQLGDSPLAPVDVNDIDPFDTTLVEKIVEPGKVELKFIEKELITSTSTSIYRVPSDPDFDPRAEEPVKIERRPSRPENLTVGKNVVFNVAGADSNNLDNKQKLIKPVTPYYTRELSITEDTNEESEANDKVSTTLQRAYSDEDFTPNFAPGTKRRHSEYPQPSQSKITLRRDLLNSDGLDIQSKVLTPAPLAEKHTDSLNQIEVDPFDTSIANNIQPSKTELRLLAKEFSCDESDTKDDDNRDLLETGDDLFQIKALTPEPLNTIQDSEDFDPFDTSFASNIAPGKTEVKLLESEFLN